jgi:hypothetical protein
VVWRPRYRSARWLQVKSGHGVLAVRICSTSGCSGSSRGRPCSTRFARSEARSRKGDGQIRRGLAQESGKAAFKLRGGTRNEIVRVALPDGSLRLRQGPYQSCQYGLIGRKSDLESNATAASSDPIAPATLARTIPTSPFASSPEFLPVKEDEATNPADVRLFGSATEVTSLDGRSHPIEEPRLSGGGHRDCPRCLNERRTPWRAAAFVASDEGRRELAGLPGSTLVAE